MTYFIDTTINLGLFQHVSQNTRVRGSQKPSLLDLVFSRNETTVTELDLETPLGASDHVVLVFKVCCQVRDLINEQTKYSFHRGNYDMMREKLSAIDWSDIEERSTEEIWGKLQNSIKQGMEESIPKRRPGTCNKKAKSKWLTPECEKVLK